MAMVIGASPTEKLPIFCGTLSSDTRKNSFPILGMKCPLASSIATSTVTVVASEEKVAKGAGTFLFFPYSEGILGCSCSTGGGVSGAGLVVPGLVLVDDPDWFLGRATVSVPVPMGP